MQVEKLFSGFSELSHWGVLPSRRTLCGGAVDDTGRDGETWGLPVECPDCRAVFKAIHRNADAAVLAEFKGKQSVSDPFWFPLRNAYVNEAISRIVAKQEVAK